MADELAQKLAEAKKKMFGEQKPHGGKVIVTVKGEAKVESPDKNVEIKKIGMSDKG